MSSINNVILIGNVGQDPQVTTTNAGIKIANLSLATSKTYKNKAGEKVEKTDWHRIVLFRGGADIAEKYVKKGSKIAIQGELRNRSYEKDGDKKYITEVYAEQIQLLDHKPLGENGSAKAEQQAEKAPEFTSPEPTDDLPF